MRNQVQVSPSKLVLLSSRKTTNVKGGQHTCSLESTVYVTIYSSSAKLSWQLPLLGCAIMAKWTSITMTASILAGLEHPWPRLGPHELADFKGLFFEHETKTSFSRLRRWYGFRGNIYLI